MPLIRPGAGFLQASAPPSATSRAGGGPRAAPWPHSAWAASPPAAHPPAAGTANRSCAGQHLGHPFLVGRVVRGDAPFGAGPQHARDLRQQRGMHEAALGVAGFRPGIGEQQEQAGRGRRPAAPGSASAHRRARAAGCGGNAALASPPSGTRRESSEQMPFSNTSQAISPARGWAAACASACSPPPNPTSSQSASTAPPNAARGSAACAAWNRSRGSVTSSRRCCRGRSLWPRARP